MAYNKDQQESPLPVNGQEEKRTSVDFLPKYFRTQANKKLLSSTLDQLIQPGVAEKLSGYFGRTTAKSFRASDTYIEDVSSQRQTRQLEPAAVVKDDLGNVQFYGDYTDLVNQIANFNGNSVNHSKLNSQEYYAWNPNIDWDKFVNFREYYWMPNGPQTVTVFGQSKEVTTTYTVTVEDQDDNTVYKFSPPGFEPNPSIRLFRGQTYRFEINTPGHPFSFSTNLNFADTPAEVKQTDSGFWIVSTIGGGENESSLYVQNMKAYDLDGNEIAPTNVEEGVIEFEVALEAPDRLYYASKNSINTSGLVKIMNIESNTAIDVNEIIGAKTYKSANEVEFTNGLKVKFIGDVTPAEYANDEWYVEGVGDKIRLINENDLTIPAAYADDVLVPFDSVGFDRLPFGNANSFATVKDYIVINRASQDRNAWTRYNKWFHKSVIESSATYNNQIASLDQNARASRPIIEFEAGLKLYNFGTQAKRDVELIDTVTTDAFSNVEGALGYNIDGIDLADGMRVIFAAETDIRVRGKIYKVSFILHNGDRQISLLEEDDFEPLENETTIVRDGNENRGKLFWFNGETWIAGQEKTKVNQAPLFDMFDSDGNSFGDKTSYEVSNFAGNKVFAYIENENEAEDSELGFGLTYRSIENLGDISFEFPLISDSFSYQVDNNIVTVNTEVGYLRKYQDLTNYVSQNGWSKANKLSRQAVVRQYIVNTQVNDFEIDVFDKSGDLNDLRVKVILNNNVKVENVDYQINRLNGVAYVTFTNDLVADDSLVLKCYSATDKNKNGYYEIAHNLERNPLNKNISLFTLGEVIDHVGTIVEEAPDYVGNAYPGSSNLRDLGNLDSYGKRFVKHTGPVNLALYHLVNKEANIIKSLKFARKEYAKFKRQFIQTAETLGFDGYPKQHVDLILRTINSQKTERMPFYFTDMVPTGGAKHIQHEVKASDDDYFALSAPFSLSEHTAKAVLVYLNNVQLTHGKDYTFNDQGFVQITADKQFRDIVDIYEYNSTDGCFVPNTPTKLGLYPAFEPQKFVDNTTLEPRTVIQGHDGSIVLAYDDFRDDLLLDLERRIYNNIKQAYRPNILDIHDFVGGHYRNTTFNKVDIDRSIVSDFVEWLEIAGDPDYTTNTNYLTSNSFTYNYSSMSSPNGDALPGWWRGVYRQAYDTDRPHTHPWEMLGFSIEPKWWQDVYGPAPYTSANLVLWEDLEEGVIREPGVPVRRNKKYARPGLRNHIPVNDQGQLLSPLESNYAQNFIQSLTREEFVYGDETPVESAWRKSSEYPFALITAWVLNQPTKIMGIGFDLSRMERNSVGNLVYTETNTILKLEDLVFPNTIKDKQRVITSGLVNYVYNYLASSTTASYETYQNNVTNIKNQLAIKVGGFTEKSKFKLILDSRTPLNEGNVFVPEENYQIILNTSAPIETVSFSGVIVEKAASGFIIKGYDKQVSEFKYYEPVIKSNDPTINVGGVSEQFVEWNERKQYVQGQNVRYNGNYYRVTNNHVSSSDFALENFAKLASLPQVGGRDAVLRRTFTKRTNTIPYGTLLRTVQGVVDFLLGYQEYLKDQGIQFEYFNTDTGLIEDWNFSVKEFLFWTTQNWAAGSVITLSPGAEELRFSREYAVVDNIFDNFYDYSLLKADGKKLERSFSSIARDSENTFGLKTKNTADGIYSVRLPLVQKEHVVLLDNKTVFNDYIYDPEAGYRQERIRVTGYRSDGWTGGLHIPGFVYDQAEVTTWEPWKDYGIGSLVKYKEFYYVSLGNLTGVEQFNSSDWERLDNRPESKLYPNFDYKINQFADFYDLDSDNFDVEQQKHAQHLIGYQKRQYLQNIINDEVSQYKFYQGMIQDKGTANALTKLFDALGSADKDSLDFYEEWAIRLGRYGATDNFEEVEYIIDEKELKLDPQPIELVDSIPLNDTDLVYKLTRGDVYSAPTEYNHAPFPVTEAPQNVTRSAGYVMDQDVSYRIDDKFDLLGKDISVIGPEDYIWVAGRNLDWDVLQLVTTEYRVTKLEVLQESADSITGSDTPRAILHLDKTAEGFKINDVIGLSNVETENQGFYEVIGVENNKVEVLVAEEQSLTATEEDETINGYVAILRSVRAKFKEAQGLTPVETANEALTGNLLDTQRVWIDGLTQNSWKVLQKSKSFVDYKEVINTDDENTDNTVQFGKSIAVNRANTLLAVGDPSNGNGKVTALQRASISTEFSPNEVLEPNLDFESFGSSVAMSEDGKVLVIGSPEATNIKTNFIDDYSKLVTYAQGSVVKHAENYWSAVREVPAENDSVSFTTFDSYGFLEKNNDSSALNMLLQGSPYLPNELTDHLLVKAPYDQYRATKLGDKLYLKWNLYTNFNRLDDADAELPTSPFPDRINPLNNGIIVEYNGETRPIVAPQEDFINGEHIIVEKVDQVLLLIGYSNPPNVGDTVTTDTGIGIVSHVFKKDFSMVLYLTDINGEFLKDGTLYRNEALVGEYTIPHYNTMQDADGWWFINTDDIYQTSNEFTDPVDYAYPGYGLVIQDIFVLEENGQYRRTTPNYYYNSLDLVADDKPNRDIGRDGELAFMTTLSHYGDAYGALREIRDSRWLVRMPQPLDGIVGVDDYINVWIDDDAQPVDEVLTNLDPDRINTVATSGNAGAHRINDIWDGYIDIELSNTQSVDWDSDGTTGDYYEPRIGDIIEDALTGTEGEVVYYIKRNISDARIYLKNVNGPTTSVTRGFTLLDNLVLQVLETNNIRQTDGSGLLNKRVLGQIRKVSLTNNSNNLGSLAVIQESAPLTTDENGFPVYSPGAYTFPANANSYGSSPEYRNLNTFAYVNKEYWIFKEELTEAGATIPASIPSTSNRDWNIVYNLPLTENGFTTYAFNKGAYSVYRKVGDTWQFINSYTLPTNDTGVGKTVDVTQDGNMYRIYIGTNERIHFIKSGFDENDNLINYALDIDPKYRGSYSIENLYRKDEVVLYNNKLYKSLTFNVGASPENKLRWTPITEQVANSHYVPIDANIYSDTLFDAVDTLQNFSLDLAVAERGHVFATSVKTTTDVDADNKVVVYRLNTEGRYVWSQSIVAPISNTGWASSIDMSADGNVLVVGDPGNDTDGEDTGRVFVYKMNGAQTPQFELTQTIRSPRNNKFEKFGTQVSITNDWIAVSSFNGDIRIKTILDEDETTFDRDFTTFSKTTTDSGSITLYQKVDGDYLVAEELEHPSVTDAMLGEMVVVNGNEVYVGSPRLFNEDGVKGAVINYSMPRNTYSWDILRESVDVVDLEKIKQVFLYNVKTNQLVDYLDYVDVQQGKVPGPAEQELTFKSYNDLARYNNTINARMYSEYNNWEDEYVGKLWWDLSTSRFKNAYSGDAINQTNRWNTIVPGFGVDVYEWVESNLIPSEWDAVADTPQGYAQGISGTSKYGDDAYSQKLVYDPVSQTFGTKYYFWVKNKFTIPDIDGRSMSAGDVAKLIQDPAGQGYRFVALLSNRRFALFNCKSLIADTDVALNVAYYTQDTQEQNVHSEYQIVSEGLETSQPKDDIVLKWIDSLTGYDNFGRQVPDPNLPVRQKYGNLFRPRQGWFVNRQEALKQTIERANIVLSQNIMVDEFDFDRLNSQEPAPLATTYDYDYVIDTIGELNFVGTVKAEPAQINLEVSNGEIRKATITNKGRSYVDPTYVLGESTRRVGPSYTVIGTGTGLKLDLTINNIGQVTKVDILNSGANYEDNTQVVVRRLSVLVRNDETVDGRWAIYEWNEEVRQWKRKRVQSYNTTMYWDYADWYATGYNQFTTIDHSVDFSYQLPTANASIGDIVRIQSIGTGGWLLLRRVAITDSRDYTEDYETIGRENGTIELSSKLYDVAMSNVGFDAFAFDSKFYDSEPVIETRQILEAIKEDLFIDTLAQDFNELFFASVRYVLSEQFNVDWIFKTSFVKAKHNVGELEQKITYQNDNLPSYNDYIEEVKPYKTNVREYLSAYERVDNTNTLTTDFDVPPFYDITTGKISTSELKVINNTLVGAEPRFDDYPDKSWMEVAGFEVTEIAIAKEGLKYSNPPQVFIEGGGGTGATAKAYIGRGRITRVEVTNPGSGYLSAPTVRLVGDVDDGGTEAKLTAIIGNSLAKSFKVISKFDRVSGEYFVVSLPETQAFTGTGQHTKFNLKWPMEIKSSRVTVYVDGEVQLRSKYTFTNIKDTTKTYDRYLGQVEFTDPPALDARIVVEYNKDPAMLQSADRIREFYKPTAGMPGVDLGQLMTGVDYGGVEVRSFDFDGPAGWDTDGWYLEPWDTYDNTYEDILFVADGTTVVIDLDEPLEDGVVYNVYQNGIRIDDPDFDTEPTNPNAVMSSITGDGETILVNLADVDADDGDRFILRKTTSDGAFLPDGDSFDTLLEGGNLTYGNASGVNAEDIVVDGDLFVTPVNGAGPEELVPGQILDTVDIKVYERFGKGQGEVYNQNYITDGVTKEFDLGLFPNSNEAVIVKLGTEILSDSEYTVDQTAETLTFNSAPTAGQRLSILSVGQNGQNILDINTIIADGSTIILETNVQWTKDLQFVYYVNGETPEKGTVIPTQNDDGFVVFEFAVGNPPEGTRLDYEIYSNEDQQNYSKVMKDTFVGDGSTVSFDLTVAPSVKGPAQYYTIVEVDGQVQSPGYNIQYNITDAAQVEYELEKFQVPNSTINSAYLEVYLNNDLLQQGVQYLVNIGNSSIIIESGLLQEGDELEIFLRDTGDYEIDGTTLTFNAGKEPADNAIINVYSFTNHDVTGMERYTYDVVARSGLTKGLDEYTRYHSLKGGKIELAKPAVGVQYVWVMVDGEWLMPTVDYELSLDKRIVYLKDIPADGVTVDVIHFATAVSTPRIAWRQFKDVLNRTHYKRIDNAQGIVLAKDLYEWDLRIEVEDSTLLPNPDRRQNKPGIMFIEGERIEYFVKDGNTLRQLRRGTLGTGVGSYAAGTAIEAQGPEKNIPYADKTIVTNYDATEGQTRITLDWIPTNGVDEFELFVAGRRLRKTELAVFDPTLALDSPEGDVIQPAEFTVELTYNEIGAVVLAEVVLAEAASEGQRITIIRKQGKLWAEQGTPLKDAQNDIGNFLRQSVSELPE
jgi:hypothetical protein